MKYLLINLLLFIIPFNFFAQTINHWETIIQTGDAVKYFVPSSDIGYSWIESEYDDDSWTQAISGVGYGDGDDDTTIDGGISSVYLRYSFNIVDIQDISNLVLDVDYDDGFIAYLNGVEITRANVSEPASWDMEVGDHEAKMHTGGLPERYLIPTSIKEASLVNGENILSVEVHNRTTASSDLSSNVFLHAGILSTDEYYSPLTEWFWEPAIYSSFNLPLMVINTNGSYIVDEPRIVADMGIINNSSGQNAPGDIWNGYNNKISIEIRGESSQQFPKKSYTIELQNPDGTNNNVSILGLPIENDFVLYAPYTDKTLMKNVLTYQIFRELGSWAPRTRYVELIINDVYKGIYVLTEKLKRDKNRVNIDKIESTDITFPEISGGYILRRDKTADMQPFEYWTSPVNQVYHQQLTYQYFDPDYYELVPEQTAYIRDYMEEFDEMLSNYSYNDPVTGYRSYIDVNSFIDILFVNEISKEIDTYVFSTYFHKENEVEGGLFFAGPPWDYNLSYGNLDYGLNENMPDTHSWVYVNGGRVYWWERLLEDSWFENEVYCRWDKFRKDKISSANIELMIDTTVAYLGAAVDRNYDLYPILGTYVWPNSYYPDTYEEEITFLKSWTMERLDWMDSQWANRCVRTANAEVIAHPNRTLKVHPNPSDFSNISFELYTESGMDELFIEVMDMNGVLIEKISEKAIPGGMSKYTMSDRSNLPTGIYIYKVYSGSELIHVGKLVKN